MPTSKQTEARQPQQPDPSLSPKLRAWAHVREVWKHYKMVCPELIEAEEEAKATDDE